MDRLAGKPLALPTPRHKQTSKALNGAMGSFDGDRRF
jgi:hypothetical protein